MLDFSRLRSGPDGWRGSFEGLVRQLGRCNPPPTAAEFRHIHGAGGDGGIEAYWILGNGDELGYQAKFHTSVRDIDWASLDVSISTALGTHPRLTAMQVAIACDLTDRVAGRNGRTGWESWEVHRAKWEAEAATLSRQVDFRIWSASEIEQLLTAPAAAGLREYWLGQRQLSEAWFSEQFQRTVRMLDERYHPEDHVEVALRAVFDGLRRNQTWRAALLTALSAVTNYAGQLPHVEGASTRTASDELDAAIVAARLRLGDVVLPADLPFPTDAWREAAGLVRAASFALLTAIRQARGSGPPPAAAHGARWIEHAEREIGNLLGAAGQLERALGSPSMKADERRAVIVTGRAGTGKSHLLAREVAQALADGEPAIMLLGTDFAGTSDPGAQLVHRLGLEVSFDQLLGMLSAAAEDRGGRALIVIDALNEGAGAALWRERLADLVARVRVHDRLALCISCRTEYADHLLKPSVRSEALLVTARGFATAEEQEAAARIYMDRRGIQRPTSPWLSPEFGNPLFLRTACIGLARDRRREFPRGLRGTRELLRFYLDMAARHLGTSYDGSDDLAPPLRRAVIGLAAAMATQHRDSVTRRQASAVVDDAFASFQNPPGKTWLDVLRSAGLVRADPGPENDHDPLAYGEDIYRFGFQRFQDHLIAQSLLEGTVGPEDLFTGTGPLGFLLSRHAVRFDWHGVFQAVAIQAADLWRAEIPDILPGGADRWWHDDAVQDAFVESARWRLSTSFSPRTTELLHALDGIEPFELLIETGLVQSHPWNADFLDGLLRSRKMPLRDATWTTHVNAAYDGDGSAGERLVEWLLQAGRRNATDESLALALTLLAWLFTSTNGRLRDRATKAATEILLERPGLAPAWLARFADRDDVYIRERVLAALAGSCLRDPDPSRLAVAAGAVWDTVFAGPVPRHTLLRDYARLIVDLAQERAALPTRCDPAACRPPYGSPAPRFGLVKDVVERQCAAVGAESIFSSCAGWGGDFGRYTIESRVRDFSAVRLSAPAPLSREEAFARFSAEHVAGDELTEILLDIISLRLGAGGKSRRSRSKALPEVLTDEEKHLRARLDRRGRAAYLRDARPHLWGQDGWASTDGKLPRIDREQAKLWVAKHAVALGWTRDLFPTDHSSGDDRTRATRVERIGKKYQWIAYHELLARLADNFWLAGEWHAGDAKAYDNPRDVDFTRDLEPTLPASGSNEGWGAAPGPTVPRLEIADVAVPAMEDWVFEAGVPLSRLRLGLCHDLDEAEDWVSLYRYASAKTSYPNRGLSGAPFRQEDFHFLSMIAVRAGERAGFVSATEAAAVDFHDWLNRDVTDLAYLYEVGLRPTWPETEWTSQEGRGGQGFHYASLCRGYHWEWHLDGSLPEGFNVEVPEPWVLRALGLVADPHQPGRYNDRDGLPVIIAGRPDRGAHLLARRSLLLPMLASRGLVPLWVGVGERTAWQNPDENAGPRRRWDGILWLHGSSARSRTWFDDHRPGSSTDTGRA